MKTLVLEVGRSLFDELEISIHHEGLPHPIQISAQDSEKLKRDLERQLVLSVKVTIRKFVTITRKSRSYYIPDEIKGKLEALEDCIGKLNSRTRLATLQLRIKPHLPEFEFLLPRRQSRLYPSQSKKAQFIQQLVEFRMDELESLINDKRNTYV
ncbi:MAG: hypothetical protein KJT03_21480 [Verrucomicrobiae bacterium]|nr:hypothetical protein [Verrucomicrobiae bacterium]